MVVLAVATALQGCSLAQPEKKLLRIEIPARADLSAKSSIKVTDLLASIPSRNASYASTIPSSLGAFTCFALNVVGPDIPREPRVNCKDPADQIGITAGTIPATGGVVELMVPSGSARQITLMGFDGQAGYCPSLDTVFNAFAAEAAGGASASSVTEPLGSPWLLAQTVVDIVSDTTVTMDVNYNPTYAKELYQSCGNYNSVPTPTASPSPSATPSPTPSPSPTGPLSVSIARASGQLAMDRVLPVRFIIAFSQPIDTSTFMPADIVQSGSAPGVTWTISDTGDHMNFTLDATSSSDGVIQPTIGSGQVRDLAGTYNDASTGSASVTLDRVAPLPAIAAGTSPTTASPILIQVNFNESVSGFSIAGILVTNGTLSGFTGSGANYEASITPSAPGAVGIQVVAGAAYDQAGNASASTASTIHYVDAFLGISPNSKVLYVGAADFNFVATNGAAPYVFSVLTGGGSITAAGAYTVPGVTGTAVIRVTDSIGETADATVEIRSALTITPTSISLPTGATQTFTASGGTSPYSYSVVEGAIGGTVTTTSPSGTLVAGGTPGIYHLRVTDALGYSTDANVTVVQPVSISPYPMQMLEKGTSLAFTASNGIGPYSFSISHHNCSGSPGAVNAATGVYTAPYELCDVWVRVTDSLSFYAESQVSVDHVPGTYMLSFASGADFSGANPALLNFTGSALELATVDRSITHTTDPDFLAGSHQNTIVTAGDVILDPAAPIAPPGGTPQACPTGTGIITTTSWTATPSGYYDCSGVDIVVKSGSTLSLYGDTGTGRGVNIYAKSFTIEAGGVVSATGKGYPMGTGPGAGNSPVSVGMDGGGAGGSYGGMGGASISTFTYTSGPTYGTPTAPNYLGSGGGSPCSGGGAGGGAIGLNVIGALNIAGAIRADGEDALGGSCISANGSGGGSGGSIWITAGSMSGTGVISANGGMGGPTSYLGRSGGGGGGGRIMIGAYPSTYTGTYSAYGGAPGSGGGGGGGSSGSQLFKRTGKYASQILDFGSSTIQYGTVNFSFTTPTFTGISVMFRGGNTAIPDGTWSGWTTVSSGATMPPGLQSKRYLQYEITLFADNTTSTPRLGSITINTTPCYGTGTYTYVKTTLASRFGSAQSNTATNVTVDADIPATTALKALVSFDGGATWSKHNGVTFIGVPEVSTIGTTGNTIAELIAGLTNHVFTASEQTVDFAFALETDSCNLTPSIRGLSFNY